MSWSRTLKARQQIRAQLDSGEEIALLFSDIRGFSTYTAKRGDRAAYHLSRLHEGILRDRIDEYGIVVKSLGDGIMAAFETPGQAIGAAVSIQRAIRERNRETPDEPIDVGIGVSSGTPVMADMDFIGHSVNMAQRLSAIAKGGQIIVTDRVRRETSLPPELVYIPHGRHLLKGIGTEDIVEVTWLKERARVSDSRDQITVILTDLGTVFFGLAKDRKQDIREAIKQLEEARIEEEGWLSVMLQRWIGRFTQFLIRGSLKTFGVAREQSIADVETLYRKGTLILDTPQGTVHLPGADRQAAERFVDEIRAMKQAA